MTSSALRRVGRVPKPRVGAKAAWMRVVGRPMAAIIAVSATLSARKLRMLVRPGGASRRLSARLPRSPTNSRFWAGESSAR